MTALHSVSSEDGPQLSLAWFGDPVQILRESVASRQDGCLVAEHGGLAWYIYFQQGRLWSAASSFQSPATLDYHLRCVGLKSLTGANSALTEASLAVRSNGNLQMWQENPVLSWLESQGKINFLQRHQILENITKEAIESFLWLTDGHYRWIQGEPIANSQMPNGANLDLEDVLAHFQKRMQLWQQFAPLIQSPHQRPYLFNQDSQERCTPELVKLGKLLRGMSIRQLALVLTQDELKVARLLYPFIQRGDVYLHAPHKTYRQLPIVPQAVLSQPATKAYKVACIDDSPTILEEMYRFLNHEEYEVTKIDDSVKAASILFELKPDLILMDITMPEINGYKLCSLLRNSVTFRETPIIMVTGRAGLIDKARAKVSGSTDYLVKPFTRGGLLAIVEKYIH